VLDELRAESGRKEKRASNDGAYEPRPKTVSYANDFQGAHCSILEFGSDLEAEESQARRSTSPL